MSDPLQSDPVSGAASGSAPRADRSAFFWLATVALIIAMLARGQTILVPLALAIVVAFALTPGVRRLERVLGRGVAVVIVVFVALGAVTAFGYLLKRQLIDLSTQMTKYSDLIHNKVVALRGHDSSGLSRLEKSINKVAKQLDEQAPEDRTVRPVRVVPAETSVTERIETTLTPVLEPAARVLVVLVLVIFLLIKREDLRDRFLRLAGRGNLSLTTRTLDEAGHRISRFLTHQSAINGGFGILVAIGLFAIGIPYAPLWGFVAAILRFIPFVGTLLAMLLPSVLAFAQFAGWWPLVATLGLFMGLDALAAYVIEPVVIGAKTGVSSMAMLVSAIFWAWLWGPVGLVLSTPLTVCLAVLGKHVPRLSYLAVLLGDEPALEDDLILYQRLLAGDEEEAQTIIERRLESSPRAKVFDDIVVPALLWARRDRLRNDISDADHHALLRTIQTLIDEPSIRPAPVRAVGPIDGAKSGPSLLPSPAPLPLILGVSARSAADEIVWNMLVQLFDPAKARFESAGGAYLAPGVVASTEAQPDVVCVLSIPPGGLAQARTISRRLRAKLPHTPIIVIRPGAQANATENAQKLKDDGATDVAFTVESAFAAVDQRLAGGAAASPTLDDSGSLRSG